MAFLIGGFLATFLLTVFFNKILCKIITSHDTRFYTSCVLSLTICTALYGFGNANGGSPDFLASFFTYSIPQAMVFVLFTIKRNKQTPVANNPYKLTKYKIAKDD